MAGNIKKRDAVMKSKRMVRKRKKKLNKYLLRRVLAILLFIFVILFVRFMMHLITNHNKEIPLTVLLNNELIHTIEPVYVDENKNIFFSKEDIQSLFDETMCYNEAEKELITTYNKHTALIKMDEPNVIINDAEIALEAPMKEIEGKIYLPIKDFAIVYDLEIDYIAENNRIIMDATSKEKIQATIIKKAKVKNKKGFWGKTVEKLDSGDTVIVLETLGNKKKIRTPLGNIGYISKEKLTNEITLRENLQEEKRDIKVFHNYSNISGIYDSVSIDENLLNVVVPIFFRIDKNNKVLDKTMSNTAAYANYMNWVNENRLVVLPTLENNQSVSATLLTYEQRNVVINALYAQIVKYQFKGININFETIDDINSFYRFIIELTPKFKESGLVVAVTMNDNLEKEKLAKIVDYVIDV